MVGSNAEPSVAMTQQTALEVPSRYMSGHAGVQELGGGDAPLRQFWKVNGVDLCHPNVYGAVGVVVNRIGTHARLDLQNGLEYLGVHAMPLSGWRQAALCRRWRGSFGA